jgi:hypothetical protein
MLNFLVLTVIGYNSNVRLQLKEPYRLYSRARDQRPFQGLFRVIDQA